MSSSKGSGESGLEPDASDAGGDGGKSTSPSI